jgi:hypothetical protein
VSATCTASGASAASPASGELENLAFYRAEHAS